MKRELLWVRWWCFAWLEADHSWEPPELSSISLQRRQALARVYHQSLGSLYGISPHFPCRASDTLIDIALSDNVQLNKLMELASATCKPMQDFSLNEQDKEWCKRIARGLKPGQWLDIQQDPLCLLMQWVDDEAIWQRLRLRFQRERAELVPSSPQRPVSAKKLDTFWQAMVWRLYQSP